jgi:hypothetical protein
MCGLENYDDIDTSDGDFFIIKLKGNLGYGIYLVDYEFIGILYDNNWYLLEKNNVFTIPPELEIMTYKLFRDMLYSQKLYNSIIEEIKAGRIKPFSIEG